MKRVALSSSGKRLHSPIVVLPILGVVLALALFLGPRAQPVRAKDLGTAVLTGGSIPPGMTPPVALLGNPALGYDQVDAKAYAQLVQTFVMPEPPPRQRLHLKFSYDIFTQDKNMDPWIYWEYDRFEVWVNGTLRLADMNTYLPPSQYQPHELGVTDADLVITGEPGTTVTVTFRVQNGWKPDGNYNTYAYLDDVRIEFR